MATANQQQLDLDALLRTLGSGAQPARSAREIVAQSPQTGMIGLRPGEPAAGPPQPDPIGRSGVMVRRELPSASEIVQGLPAMASPMGPAGAMRAPPEVQAPPVAPPPMDSAAQRAQAASGFFPAIGDFVVSNVVNPLLAASSARQAVLDGSTGYVASALGATDTGADLLRRSDAASMRMAQLMGAGAPAMRAASDAPAAAPAPATDAPAPNAPAPSAPAPNAPAPMTEEQLQQMRTQWAMQQLAGMSPQAFAQMSQVLGPPATLSPRDAATQLYVQRGLERYMPILQDRNASVEDATAAEQALMQILQTAMGANPLFTPGQ